LTACTHCAHEGPEGIFCATCGAHRAQTGRGGIRRQQHFAAHPGEHLLQPSLFSTLLPHLGRRRVNDFRAVFLGGIVGLFVLYLSGLITAALAVAVLLLPILYVLYLYEAQVYKEEPVPVIALVGVVSIGLGVGVTIGTNHLLPRTSPLSFAVTGSALVAIGVWVPLIQEAAKPLAALALRVRRVFRDETMDGLVFGVAAGLGFGVGESFVRLSRILIDLPVHTTPGEWIYPLLTTAVLTPVLQGTTTGLICAALWRFGRGRVDLLSILALALALAGHVVFNTVSQVLINHGWAQLAVLAFQAAIGALLLLYMRVLLHSALLEEARDAHLAERYCSNCHSTVLAGGFCPNCGMALPAVPYQTRPARVQR
jgi:RsiW-degrading membrane proteinase PrsW (M82 family)